MKRILLISFLLTLFAGYSFAQCDEGEVELRVEILTDIYGGETSWTITDLEGTVVLAGGQGGVYQNNTSYSDSICVSTEGCFFFEIYDTYGDGILAPGGYELYVDEVLIASGGDDFENYALVIFSCPAQCDMILNALNDLQAHINSITPLNTEELILIRNFFTLFPECLAENEEMISLAQNVVEDYDAQIGALFTTPNTQYGVPKDTAAAPGLDLERAMIALQQGMFDHIFVPEVYADYPEHINGYKYNSCLNFPGYVEPPADSAVSYSVLIRANFKDPDGINPYFEINGDGTEHALRPTGLYLAPGCVSHVSVPVSLVGKDYYVRVGSHEWDLSNKSVYKRLDRISKKFLIDSTTIKVFNPLGGAISILVPYEASQGIVEVSVNNCVECPFFSMKSFYQSPNFNAELNKPGP
jgi:hypothetical protein